ncbi:hypothetical protein HUJ04_013388 [Dendroctonus ponderosae]
MENTRIFVSDLPENIAQDQLESRFSKYGQVNSIEIKQRKELGPNQCPRFAYINLVTDHRRLNQCFKEFSSVACAGHYLQLQIAKENFLERLKRERQEADQAGNKVEVQTSIKSEDVDKGKPIYSQPAFKQNAHKTNGKTINEPEIVPKKKRIKIENIGKLDDFEEQTDIIIKNNKGKLLQPTLKIASTTQNSIAKPATDTKKNDSDANIKRLQSLKNMKERYAAKKHLIQSGLSSVGEKPNKKIVFDDEADNNRTNRTTNGVKRPALFDDDDVEDPDDFEANFDVKEQFEGPSGQKLLELQSRFKNDKRFNLDKRFIEDNEDIDQEPDEKDDDDADLEAEKYDQLKILEDVLGKKIIKKSNREETFTRKAMLKYDPTRPEHSSLILKPDAEVAKSDGKVKKKGQDECKEPEPEVSKEIFYKVPESLKTVFEGSNRQFSLLSAFGKPEKIEEANAEELPAKTITSLSNYPSHNPFKHDSSDEENEAEDIPHKGTAEPSGPKSDLQQNNLRSSQTVFWTEPFFFKIDDFRLQEGFDFIEKMKASEKEFVSVRRQVKEIVKSKVRNNERKIKMFKNKLGGSKKRKHIRMKKALKR